MPRITKEEVRASIQHREAKKKTSRTLEEVKNEKKAKEELPYPITSEGLYPFAKTQEESAGTDAKRSAEVSNNNTQVKAPQYPRTVEITGTGITAAKSSTEAAREMKKIEDIETAIEQPVEEEKPAEPVENKKYFAISAEDMQKTNEKLIQLQKEKEELEATVTLLETETSGIKDAEESFKKRLDEKQAEYDNLVDDRNQEVALLKSILSQRESTINELQRKLPRGKKRISSEKLGELAAYILAGILSAGILGVILMVVAKLLSLMWNWLF